jgi:hypothetical protein
MSSPTQSIPTPNHPATDPSPKVLVKAACSYYHSAAWIPTLNYRPKQTFVDKLLLSAAAAAVAAVFQYYIIAKQQ